MKEGIEKIVNNSEQEKDLDMPPKEILRENEIVEQVLIKDVNEVVNSIDKKDGSSKKVKNFLLKWGLRGLMLLTWGYNINEYGPMIKEGLKDYDFSIDGDKKELFDETKKEYDVPEIVIYGNRDERTDVLLNYLSGKDPLPENMEEELTVRFFFDDVMQSAFDKEIPKDENIKHSEINWYHEYSSFIVGMKNKIKSFDETDFKNYVTSKEYVKDMVEFKFFTTSITYVSSHPVNDFSYQSKCDYIKNFYSFLGLSKDGKDKFMKMSNEEVEEFVLRRDNNNVAIKDLFSKKDNFYAGLYDAVWTMQFKHGNPKIDLSYQYSSNMKEGKRAYYTPSKNKMYLGVSPRDASIVALESWLAELSHSEQYSTKPQITKFRGLIDDLRIMYKTVVSKDLAEKSYDSYYDEILYNLPGTVEYEAHKEIEPKLTEELFERLKN